MKLPAVPLVVSVHVDFPACYISISHTLPIVQKSHFTRQLPRWVMCIVADAL